MSEVYSLKYDTTIRQSIIRDPRPVEKKLFPYTN